MLKLMILPRTRRGLTRHALHHHLEQVHGPLCMAHADVGGHFRRYVHHYVTTATEDPLLGERLLGDRDAITIIGFDGPEAFRASVSSAGYRDVISPDEDNFREVEGSLAFFVEETVLRDGGGAGLKLFHLRRFAEGIDHVQGSRLWRERIARALDSRAFAGLTGYVHNRVLPGEGGAPAYHAIDEISLGAGTGDWSAAAAAATIALEEDGLFEVSTSAALVTRAKVFIP